MEAFRRYDHTGSGFISALDFQDIMVSIKSHLLTPEVKANLVAAAGGGQMGKRVSFPYFMAFNSLLNNMELIKRIYLNATAGSRNQEVTKGNIDFGIIPVVNLLTPPSSSLKIEREKFYPGPGIEPRPPALCTGTLTLSYPGQTPIMGGLPGDVSENPVM